MKLLLILGDHYVENEITSALLAQNCSSILTFIAKLPTLRFTRVFSNRAFIARTLKEKTFFFLTPALKVKFTGKISTILFVRFVGRRLH